MLYKYWFLEQIEKGSTINPKGCFSSYFNNNISGKTMFTVPINAL
jgi:hypothetical protein